MDEIRFLFEFVERVIKILFTITNKLRITLPVLYVLIVPLCWSKWVEEHTILFATGLGILVLFSLLSWFITAKDVFNRLRQ